MTRTWFITGTSRGFGRSFARAALERGDDVAATFRTDGALDGLIDEMGEESGDLLPLQLDVTDRDAVRSAVEQTVERFGSLDVVVNNAGYGQFGMVEELTPAALQEQLDANLFGPLHVVQAALPHLREQGSGHVVQVSSIGGVGAFPNLSAYHASKWALEAMSESLAAEVAGFGVHVTIVEPGGFETDWAGDSSRHADQLDAYDPVREQAAARRAASTPGDPDAAARVLLGIVDDPEPPLRVLFGAQALGIVEPIVEGRLQQWRATGDLARAAQG